MVTPLIDSEADGSGADPVAAVIHDADQCYQRGECDRAVDMLLAAIRRTGPESRLVCGLAELLIDSERFQNALDILALLPPEGWDTKARELSAFCCTRLGDGDTAGRLAAQVLEENPGSALAMIVRGLIARLQADADGAGVWFRRAIAADPDGGEAFLQLGLLHKTQGVQGEALEYFERALNKAPASGAAALNFHAQAVAMNQIRRAEEILRKILHQRPLDRRLRFLRIDLLLRMGEDVAIMDAIEAAMADFGVDDGLLKAALDVRQRLGSPDESSRAAVKDGVSLCMIVKNEERYLARCLLSVAPIVNEMVLVDTGSTDRTKDIARVFGARLYDHPWKNDFAKARNAALSKVGGKWVLVLDADEVISASDHDRIRELVRRQSDPAVAFAIRTRNYSFQMNVVGWEPNSGEYPVEEAGTGWFASEKVRLFPNDPRIRFVHAVHEMVEPTLQKAGIPVRVCDVPVHHYGKLQEDLSQRKTRLYRKIEDGKIRETGSDPAALRESAIQAAQLGSHDEALALWQQILNRGLDSAEVYVNMGTALWHLGRYDEALRSAEAAIRIDPDMKEARFNLAMAALHCGNAARAVGELEGLVRRDPRYAAGRFLMAAAYGCMGESKKALAVIEPLRATPLGAHLAVSFFDLARRLAAADCREYSRAVGEVAVQGGFADADLKSWLRAHVTVGECPDPSGSRFIPAGKAGDGKPAVF